MAISPSCAGASALVIVALAAARASGYAVGPAVPLEEMAKTADLVCKATVVADRPATDAWFEPVAGFEVRDTELQIVSILKGAPGAKTVWFRHYTPSGTGALYEPQHYQLTQGRSYLVLAAKASGGVYRQLWKRHTSKEDQGVMLAADARPHRGKTLTEAAWAELDALLASQSTGDVVQAIVQLDAMSGGRMTELKDFDRRDALGAIRPKVGAPQVAIATAAIAVFGADSPYFDDQQAPFWLAGVGKGEIPGLSPRKPGGDPAAAVAVIAAIAAKELLAVADGPAAPELRAQAIRALGRAAPAGRPAAWSRDPEAEVRGAAVLVSAALIDHKLIAAGATDRAPEVRRAAALAIGFAQDPALVSTLGTLLKDGTSKVRAAAALALLSFAIDQAAPVMKANLGTDYRPLFVNALARRDAQLYLPLLAEVIEKQLRPGDWWGGTIPAADSWSILFAYVKIRPASELAAGKLDRSLDALERMQWFSSSEPRDLYALYLRRGLAARAKQFRDATRKSVAFDMEYYFDMADKSPETYVP